MSDQWQWLVGRRLSLGQVVAVRGEVAADDSDESERLADLLGAIDRALEPQRHQGTLL